MGKIKLIKVSAEYAEKILEYKAEYPDERMRVTCDPIVHANVAKNTQKSSLGLVYRKQKNSGLIKCELFAVI